MAVKWCVLVVVVLANSTSRTPLLTTRSGMQMCGSTTAPDDVTWTIVPETKVPSATGWRHWLTWLSCSGTGGLC
jgi:hypothetical protein